MIYINKNQFTTAGAGCSNKDNPGYGFSYTTVFHLI